MLYLFATFFISILTVHCHYSYEQYIRTVIGFCVSHNLWGALIAVLAICFPLLYSIPTATIGRWIVPFRLLLCVSLIFIIIILLGLKPTYCILHLSFLKGTCPFVFCLLLYCIWQGRPFWHSWLCSMDERVSFWNSYFFEFLLNLFEDYNVIIVIY